MNNLKTVFLCSKKKIFERRKIKVNRRIPHSVYPLKSFRFGNFSCLPDEPFPIPAFADVKVNCAIAASYSMKLLFPVLGSKRKFFKTLC
jgi:hypothetical protein